MFSIHYKEIKWNLEKVSNIIRFINKFNWQGINYPSKIGDWKTFEKNNPTIAFNIFYTKEEVLPAYGSKHDPTRKKTNNSVNDFKRRKRRMALSCSKKLYIIKRSNIRTW